MDGNSVTEAVVNNILYMMEKSGVENSEQLSVTSRTDRTYFSGIQNQLNVTF